MLLSFFLLFFAVLMVLFLNLYVDVDFKGEFSLTITLNIFSIQFFKEKSKKNSQNKQKNVPKRGKSNKIQVVKLLIRLIEKSKVEITEIFIPKIYYDNGIFPEFITEPILVSLVTVILAYLSTKSEKLYFAEENNEERNSEKLIFRAKLKLNFSEALVFLFNYLRIRKRENKMHRQKV